MKKTLALLVFILTFSSLTFGSFYVEKSASKSEHSAVATMETKATASSNSNSGAGSDSTIAIILAIVSVVLLPFGLHNWYLGRTKQALWQTLLVFPGFILILPLVISWVWQVVDLIRLLINGSL